MPQYNSQQQRSTASMSGERERERERERLNIGISSENSQFRAHATRVPDYSAKHPWIPQSDGQTSVWPLFVLVRSENTYEIWNTGTITRENVLMRRSLVCEVLHSLTPTNLHFHSKQSSVCCIHVYTYAHTFVDRWHITSRHIVLRPISYTYYILQVLNVYNCMRIHE